MLAPYPAEAEHTPTGKPWQLSDTQSMAEQLIRSDYSFYLASFSGDDLGAWANLNPLNIPVEPVTIDDTTTDSKQSYKVMDLYESVNALSFGPKGIPLPRWVELDIGLLASAFFITALPRERIETVLNDTVSYSNEQLRSMHETVPLLLKKADEIEFDGPIPVAGYCASTTPVPHKWNGWSLCSIIPGLGTITKGLALEAYGAEKLTGVTQWSNFALRVHRNLGATTVKKAREQLHTLPDTLVYETELYKQDERKPTHLLRWGGYAAIQPTSELTKEAEANNAELIRELDVIQSMIKNGCTVNIMRPGRTPDGSIPLHISEPA